MENRIRILRKSKGLTMKQLGVLLGVSESAISQYETGKRQVDNATLLKLGDVFGVPVGYILGAEGKEKSSPITGELNPQYYDLTEENRAMVDDLIVKLLKSQSVD